LGKQLEHLAIGQREDRHRDHHDERQERPEFGVLAQSEKCFFRTVAGSRQAVRAQSGPCQRSGKPRALASGPIERVAPRTEDQTQNSAWYHPDTVIYRRPNVKRFQPAVDTAVANATKGRAATRLKD